MARIQNRARDRVSGFSTIELLVVMAILIVIAGISTAVFRNMYHSSALRAGGSEVYEALINARGKTLSSESDTVYGVHIGTSTVTRFEGATYIPGSATNKVYSFEGGVTATGTIVSSSGDVIFTRLTGESSASGTIDVRDSERTSTTTIRVYTSGLIEYE